MRKSVLALMAGGSVFAITAAAASTMTVTSPFNPFAGQSVSADSCDLGAVDVDSTNDGQYITSLRLKTANSGAADSDCTASVNVWVRLGKGSGAFYYLKVPANVDYTTGHEASFLFTALADPKIYSAVENVAGGSILKTQVEAQPLISAVDLGISDVVVTTGTAAPLNWRPSE